MRYLIFDKHAIMNKDVYEYISQVSGENISKRERCELTSESFPIFESDRERLSLLSPTVGEVKYNFPTPKKRFSLRQMNRMMFRNEGKLYRRKCDITGKSLISIYTPEYTGTVCSQAYRWSEDRDALDFGRPYTFEKTFTQQFKELYNAVPKMATTVQESENCEFTNSTGDSKNCYMSFRCHYSSNALYSYRPNRSENCVDCYQVKNCDKLYRCVYCTKSQNSTFLYHSNNCFDSHYLLDCVGCSNCFMCCNLANATYCIGNKQYTKEEYHETVSKFKNPTTETFDKLWKKFENLQEQAIYSNIDTLQTEGSIGSGLVECSDCFMSFMMRGCNGSRRAWDNVNYVDCMDNYSGGDSKLCYNTSAAKKCYRTSCCLRMKECEECLYSMFCFRCKNCFGCIGLKRKEYCIFNVQYTREEYNELLPRIIAQMQENNEWGGFFDPSISAFPFNDTIAAEYFPLHTLIDTTGESRELDAKGTGCITLQSDGLYVPAHIKYESGKIHTSRRVSETEVNVPDSANTIHASDLPESIDEVSDDILKKVIICSVSGRPYRIVVAELSFYREMGIPLPRNHPDIRHKNRLKASPKRELGIRKCDKTGDQMISVHDASTPYKVYKEEIYDQIMFG